MSELLLKAGDYHIEGNGEEGITKVMPILEGNGLRAGIYRILCSRFPSSICPENGKNVEIRVELNRNTTWQELLDLLPKGTFIENWIQIR